jgi:hypothetical protein
MNYTYTPLVVYRKYYFVCIRISHDCSRFDIVLFVVDFDFFLKCVKKKMTLYY